MELSSHDSFLEHANVVSIRVEASKLLKVVVELYLFQNFGHEVHSTDKALHICFKTDMRVGTALPHITFK